MNLEILLPSRVLLRQGEVLRIVAETLDGSFGLLPHRLDCVAALKPGILSFETAAEGEVFVAIDEGVLVKAGGEVRVTARRAIAGADLRSLRETVERDYLRLDAEASSVRQVLAKLETGFVSRFSSLQKAAP